MNDEKNYTGRDFAEGNATFLFLFVNFVPGGQGVRIVKYRLSGLEVDAMFDEILPAFPLVVLESYPGSPVFLTVDCVRTNVNTQ